MQQYESRKVLENLFDNSLPAFLTAFMAGKKISEDEAEALKALIDRCQENDDERGA